MHSTLSTGLFPRELRTNAKVRKFSGFFEFSISTSAYLGSRVYVDLAYSAKVTRLERTFHDIQPSLVNDWSTFSRCTWRKVWPTKLGSGFWPCRHLYLRKVARYWGKYGVKVSKAFFSKRTTGIVFRSICWSRKVVLDQSELKNSMTNGLATSSY